MKKSSLPLIFIAGCMLALFIRLLLIPNPGFEADVAFWKSWGLAVLDFGIVKGLAVTNFNYPTPFGYFLALMPAAYRLLSDPHNFNQYWQNTNLLFLIVSKLPAIIADFGIAGLILWIGKNVHSDKTGAGKIGFPDLPLSFYSVLALVYLLNPVSWMDSAWWGQVDSIGVIVFLGAFLLVLTKRPFLAGMVYMVAMMTKLQNMIYGPIFFLFIWQYVGFDGLVRSLAGSLVTFAGLNIEFILSGSMWKVIESLTGNYDYFPWLSLNAFNLWWIISGARGMQFSDKLLSVGLVNAKTVGLSLFSAGYLLAALMLKPFAFLKKYKEDASTVTYHFLTALVIANAAFFLFQTESHDRYAFPLIVFLLLWGVFYIRRHLTTKEIPKVFTSGPFRAVSFFYVLFTLFYFYNLHAALVFNYPHNGMPILSNLIQPNLTISVSLLLICLFFFFLLVIRRDVAVWNFLVPPALVICMLTAKNLPLITHTPVSLTTLTPVSAAQDYGIRQINMPVNAYSGFDKWGSLSVQYAFYRRGVGTHANSIQTFDVKGHFTRFSFDYGIDTEAGPRGSVVFEVYGLPAGEAGDYKLLFASEKIGRYDLPRHADVNITGVSSLKLVVTDAGDGITDDHADWLNPKLYL
ncbi:MAG: NPCBM/NEW2 domain-containing protein [Candidatus Gottesmanbacteria bacterium]|nr:NPCBM/NEW2 domain-containing protein [Candidatus Gottesmanbacteria bacterium]